MSHEIRTPLNAIIGFSDAHLYLSGKNGASDTQSEEYFQHIREASHHLKSLVDDLLDFSKIEMGEIDIRIEPVHLEHIIEQAASHLGPETAEFGVQINLINSKKEHIIETDSRIVYQIVLNIISNAVKYSRAEGKINIRLFRNEKSEIKLLVRDYGIGMTKEEISVARRPFMRIENPMVKRQGTGLGIPIVEMLLEKIGGDLSIKSIPGSGTIVTAILKDASLGSR